MLTRFGEMLPRSRNRRDRLFFWAIVLALHAGSAFGEQPRLPNVIVVVSDDQGWADVGFNGCKDIPTPNIDRIANEGVRCEAAYVTYAVCAPSRAGLLTGRYQDRFGFCRNPSIRPEHLAGLPPDEETMAEILGRGGYHCGAVGKWHLGTHPSMRPLEQGFHEFFGFLSGGHEYFPERLTLRDLSEVAKPYQWYQTRLLRNNTRVEIGEYLTDELSREAVSFIARNLENPFFLYLAYNAPHTPLQATKKYLDRFDSIADPTRRKYAAMVSAIDDGVGKVLNQLDETHLSENTLVFFLSDNGGATNNGSNNGPLRGHKGSPHEGGLRVPFAVRWTGQIRGGLSFRKPVSSLDILGTMAALSNTIISDQRPLDGVNLVPCFKGESDESPHEALFWRWADEKRLAVRTDQYKMIIEANPGQEDQLFDLRNDVGESRNLLKTETGVEIAKRLRAMAEKWAEPMKEPAFPGLGSWKPQEEPTEYK